MVRLLVVSETRLHREGLAAILGAHAGITVVGTDANAAEALAGITADSYEVVLIDAVAEDSVQTVRDFLQERAESRIVVLGASDTSDGAPNFVDEGAGAALSCDANLEQVVEAIGRVAAGEKGFPQSMVVGRLEVSLNHGRGQPHPDLTAREIEILRLIDRGLSNGTIAQRLQIEVATVKNHVHNILRKLNVKSRALAAAWLRSHRARDKR